MAIQDCLWNTQLLMVVIGGLCGTIHILSIQSLHQHFEISILDIKNILSHINTPLAYYYMNES